MALEIGFALPKLYHLPYCSSQLPQPIAETHFLAQQVMVKMSDSDSFPAPCGMALHSLPWFMEQSSLCWSKVLFTI
jgi:hypothetical protein